MTLFDTLIPAPDDDPGDCIGHGCDNCSGYPFVLRDFLSPGNPMDMSTIGAVVDTAGSDAAHLHIQAVLNIGDGDSPLTSVDFSTFVEISDDDSREYAYAVIQDSLTKYAKLKSAIEEFGEELIEASLEAISVLRNQGGKGGL